MLCWWTALRSMQLRSATFACNQVAQAGSLHKSTHYFSHTTGSSMAKADVKKVEKTLSSIGLLNAAIKFRTRLSAETCMSSLLQSFSHHLTDQEQA
jgi:hypothetical protein